MYLCYMDEAGCTGSLPAADSNIQPLIVIGAIIVEDSQIRSLTLEFLRLKRRFFPKELPFSANWLQWILVEIKGSTLRNRAKSPMRRQRSHAYSFLDAFVQLLESYAIKIVGRLWIKGIGSRFKGRSVYTCSVQHICTYFNHYVASKGNVGLIIADSRDPALNANLSHSIFTKKFKATGDEFPGILEMPTFGHSENHAGIQIADILCSALLFPMAASTYCLGHVSNCHVHASHLGLRNNFGPRLRALQYMYHDGTKLQGGITVSDIIGRKSSAAMF